MSPILNLLISFTPPIYKSVRAERVEAPPPFDALRANGAINLKSRNQSRFATQGIPSSPCGHHLDEPALVARVPAEQVVLGVEAAVAVDGQRAAALVARIAPDALKSRLLIQRIGDA